MEPAAGKESAYEEHTYDEAFEMSEAVQPVNARTKIKNNPYEGRANVKDSQDRYDDVRLPLSIRFKRDGTRWMKGAAVVSIVNSVVMIAVIIYLGIREGIDQSNQKVDGGWNVWGPWSGCSTTCNTGMESRNRACSNPKPSNGGDHCIGESAEYRLCYKFECPDANVGFTVYNADSSSGTGSNPLKFHSTLYNSDASFNNSTGVFTCIHPGVYFFSATVMRTATSSGGSYSCYFIVNNIPGIFVLANDYSNSQSYPGSSASIVLRLNKNDTVNLGSCSEGTYMYSSGVSFTGFRISP